MAAVVGARLAVYVQQSLDIDNVTFWSDRQIVLYWLTSSHSQKRFVHNRVHEIKQMTGNHTWHYCPSADNPAYLLTRGVAADQLTNNTLWKTGPTWLLNKQDWPKWDCSKTKIQQTNLAEIPMECVRNNNESTRAVNSLQCTPQEDISQVIDIKRYNKYQKVPRVTTYVFRFIQNCRNLQTRKHGVLTVNEIEAAERIWLQSCQRDGFIEEINCLKTNNNVPTTLCLIRQLRLFIDNHGIIRCGGRIHNSLLSDDTKFPDLLPRQHPLTRLIVYDAHEIQLHGGINATTTQIRQKYWIPAIRQCVRSILRKCVTCNRVHGKPYRTSNPPPLPKIRVEESPPFSVTGVDYTGTLYVRDRNGTETKVYICLFTCACTHAIHLEIVSVLTRDSFMQAFRRFAGRRSHPKILMSDNSTTFVGASYQLKRLFGTPSIQEELSNKGTDWQFIPKRAPWYGGWWERLIGLTKNTLKKILGRSMVTMETLQTVIVEIEAMLNDRPLTAVSSSYDDMEPLTPSHLLHGRRLTSLPNNQFNLDDVLAYTRNDHVTFNKQLKQQNAILDRFWKQWRTEYLTALRETHRTTGANKQTISARDIVQIHDKGPRNHWKLGVVEELLPGRDGLTRAAKVKTKHGLTTRPIVKLYPLEVFSDIDT